MSSRSPSPPPPAAPAAQAAPDADGATDRDQRLAEFRNILESSRSSRENLSVVEAVLDNDPTDLLYRDAADPTSAGPGGAPILSLTRLRHLSRVDKLSPRRKSTPFGSLGSDGYVASPRRDSNASMRALDAGLDDFEDEEEVYGPVSARSNQSRSLRSRTYSYSRSRSRSMASRDEMGTDMDAEGAGSSSERAKSASRGSILVDDLTEHDDDDDFEMTADRGAEGDDILLMKFAPYQREERRQSMSSRRLTMNRRTLFFTDRTLEASYARFISVLQLPFLRMGMLFLAALSLAYIGIDEYLYSGTEFHMLLGMRVLFSVGLLLTYVFTWVNPQFVIRHYTVLSFVSPLFGLVLVNATALLAAHGARDEHTEAEKRMGLSAAVVVALVYTPFSTYITHLRVKYAVVQHAVALTLFSTLVVSIGSYGPVEIVSAIAYIAFASTIALYHHRNRERVARSEFMVRRSLRREKTKTRVLLRNMLPAAVVDELAHGKSVVHNAVVTVAFVSIVDFHLILRDETATGAVTLLDRLYTMLDKLVDTSPNITKIETVFDTFVVVCGLPQECPAHALVMGQFLFELREAVTAFANRVSPIEIKIGMHTGPVVAGTVGTTRLFYRLVGDTVNTCSRLASLAHAGDILVSKATADLLREAFVIVPKGMTQVKGKGEMDLYVVSDQRMTRRRPTSFDGGTPHRHSTNSALHPSQLEHLFPGRRRSSSLNPFMRRYSSATDVKLERDQSSPISTVPTRSSPTSSSKVSSQESSPSSSRAASPPPGAVAAAAVGSEWAGEPTRGLRLGQQKVLHDYMYYLMRFDDERVEADFRRSFWTTHMGFMPVICRVAAGAILFFALVEIAFFIGDDDIMHIYSALSRAVGCGFALLYIALARYAPRFVDAHHTELVVSIFLVVCATLVTARTVVEEPFVVGFSLYIVFTIYGSYLLSIQWVILVMFSVGMMQVTIFLHAATTDVLVQAQALLFITVVTGLISSRAAERSARLTFALQLSLKEEREQFDRLLENLLPLPIIDRLKDGVPWTAQEHPGVSVLMLDLASFTFFSSRAKPQEIFEMLNSFFQRIDQLVARFPFLYKIDSVGDAVVVVGGLFPSPHDRHQQEVAAAENILDLALQILEMMESVRHPLRARIGVAHGPVVSGIVGQKVPKLHLWGQAVDDARDLEVNSGVGSCLANESIVKLTKQRYEFVDTVMSKGRAGSVSCTPRDAFFEEMRNVRAGSDSSMGSSSRAPAGASSRGSLSPLIRPQVMTQQQHQQHQRGTSGELPPLSPPSPSRAPMPAGVRGSGTLLTPPAHVARAVSFSSQTADEPDPMAYDGNVYILRARKPQLQLQQEQHLQTLKPS